MRKFKTSFYAGRDPADLPAYEVTEAARYLRVPVFTLYSWLRPVAFDSHDGPRELPLIQRPDGSSNLSFLNLVEAHVLKGLRETQNMPTAEIRRAIDYAERRLGISRLLAHEEFSAGGKQIFLERMGKLISLGRGGQLAFDKLLDQYLQRVTYKKKRPIALDPFVLGGEERHIKISPEIAFGKPVVASANITTYVIAERFELGEDEQSIARDYKITEAEVEEAILYQASQAA